MFMGAATSPPTAKKSRRSTSPRAVEQRKLQNRIAQRNHRRRVREAAQAQQGLDGTSISEKSHDDTQRTGDNTDTLTQSLSEQQTPTASGPEYRTAHINPHNLAPSGRQSSSLEPPTNDLDNMIMADDMVAQHEQNLPYVEMMMRNMPDKENRRSQSTFTPQGCTCNAATGPCPYHLEKIRAQFLSETVSPMQMHQHQNHHMADFDLTKSHPLPPSPMSHYSQSTSSVGSSQQPLYFNQGSNRMPQSRQPSTTMSQINKLPSSIGSHISSSRDISPATLVDTPMDSLSSKGRSRASTTSAAENTRRFGVMLDAMKTAGFQDFDAMILEYYTARFEMGSFPAMAQCASRSRRMKAMLQELQEHSSQWPRWESRGLHESVSEATVSLCLEEVDRLNKAHMLDQALQSEPANLITAFEWLLETGGHGNASILEELGFAGNINAAPDEMPYLWSFLTELAGPRGLYCDRIARILMVILLYARRT